ncbi:MAG: hypothetical protein A2W08_00020 [Candidatus Rokubacteria bacterium RBG_16_73_20]|nr:MAG: hypothetical protein A2W08_00020 [Candidatus Rokubacteria bacterium RBG_16_73_20]
MRRWAVAAGLAVLCAATAAATEDLRIGLATTPRLPARSERTTFEITVADAAGAPQAGARVSLELIMRAHAMKENRPRVQERGGGRYVAAGTFSMGGDWIAVVEVVLPGGRRARAEFPLRVR